MISEIALAFAALSTAAELPTSCPMTLAADALSVRAPAGWHGSAPTFLRLTGSGVMRGHPDEKGYLVPDSTHSEGGRRTVSFSFDPGDEKWLWCVYGTGSPQLAKRLSDAANQCNVSTRRSKTGSIEQMEVTCHVEPISQPSDATPTQTRPTVMP